MNEIPKYRNLSELLLDYTSIVGRSNYLYLYDRSERFSYISIHDILRHDYNILSKSSSYLLCPLLSYEDNLNKDSYLRVLHYQYHGDVNIPPFENIFDFNNTIGDILARNTDLSAFGLLSYYRRFRSIGTFIIFNRFLDRPDFSYFRTILDAKINIGYSARLIERLTGRPFTRNWSQSSKNSEKERG